MGQKWRWYEGNTPPWNRAGSTEMARREAFVRWPVHGNVLEALREGRLEIGRARAARAQRVDYGAGGARVRIGAGSFLNIGVMVAAVELVEIGSHCMLANGCFVTDGNHRFDDPDAPVPWQGFTTKGPTRIGDNVWLGANVVVTSGVTIGERCVIGANSVVTTDLPPFTIAAGAPPGRCGDRVRRGGLKPGLLVRQDHEAQGCRCRRTWRTRWRRPRRRRRPRPQVALPAQVVEAGSAIDHGRTRR